MAKAKFLKISLLDQSKSVDDDQCKRRKTLKKSENTQKLNILCKNVLLTFQNLLLSVFDFPQL